MKTISATPEEARAIAREAYIYAFPMVETYKTLYKQAIDRTSPDYKAPLNQLGHSRTVATPNDKFVVTPNSDTPYSFAWLDLCAEPMVITLPKIEPNRYYSVQLVDLYTHNFGFLGTRSFDNEGGDFLIAGPDWRGEKPGGIRAVIPCETRILYALFRTQLFNPVDLKTVHQIQDAYQVQPLNLYLGNAALHAAPAVDWPPLVEGMSESVKVFSYLNFLLQFCPTHPSEKEMMARFAKLGIGAGKPFSDEGFAPEIKKAIEEGIAAVWQEDFDAFMKRANAGEVTSGDLFGTREFLKNNYLYRFAGAKLGLFGLSREEALYPPYFVDAQGDKLDGAKYAYVLRFEKGQVPPAGAFWSFTMYDGSTQFLVANPLNRYLLNSTMLDSFQYGVDGSLTFTVQKDSPGAGKESNWLPAPAGPFYCIMRIYIPQPAVFSGQWKQPPLQRVAAVQAKAHVTPALKVTPETYIRAESDRQFGVVAKMAGGVNRFYHFRRPTPLDKQNVVRMNRDTLYSMGIVDTSKGATLTVPELPKDRYASVYLVDNDHYCPFVIYSTGTHELPGDTKYLGVGVRIQVFNPKDENEIALINKLQDQFIIKANSAEPMPDFKWDLQSLKALTDQFEKESTRYSSWKGMMGPRGKVDEKTRHIAAAAAWGLFPEWDATYLNYSGGHDYRVCHKATYQVPENEAFWSITVYGNDGFMKSDNNIVNSSTVKLNADGTFTVYFGSVETCGEAPNRLDTTEGWNFLMRIYRPGKSVLEGAYQLPAARPVK
jgi:hypothetical protein